MILINRICTCRIQFEVSVRVLGGLMSLGYQIGTIMRRTSTIVSTSDGATSVKFDDVENLGKYVQVGKHLLEVQGWRFIKARLTEWGAPDSAV
jgi:predicted lipoprotein